MEKRRDTIQPQTGASEYELHKYEYDAATFSHEPYAESVKMDWGHKLIWSTSDVPYIGSELQFEGSRKTDINESDRFRILVYREGQAWITLEDENGEMHESQMEYGVGFRIQSGQKYSIRTEGETTNIMEGSEKEARLEEVKREKFSTNGNVKMDHSKNWGYEYIFGLPDDPITMKILHVEEDECLSLQAHSHKVESYFMSYGKCDMIMENSDRELDEFPLEYGMGYTTKVGQRHRHQGGSRMEVFEVSSPEKVMVDGELVGTTWRIEDKYGRGDQTPAVRQAERGDI